MAREKIDIGRVGLVERGVFLSSSRYSKWDFVYYKGSTYLYINDVPSTGSNINDRLHWRFLAQGNDLGGRYRWQYNETDDSLELIYIG